jgi:hypothetical protein
MAAVTAADLPAGAGRMFEPAPIGSYPTVFAATGGSGGRSGAVTAGLYARHGRLTGSGRSAARADVTTAAGHATVTDDRVREASPPACGLGRPDLVSG